MTHHQRHMNKLEGIFTDTTGLVPHSQRWLEYWDRQYYLFLTVKEESSIRLGSVVGYRAVMKYAEESPASLVRRFLEGDRANEDHFLTAPAA